MHSPTSVLLLNSLIFSWHLSSKWLMVELKGWSLQRTGISLWLTSCSQSGLFWSCQRGCHQLYSFISLLGNMFLPSDLSSWPACLIPEQHSGCMGTPRSAQLLRYLLFCQRDLAFLSMISKVSPAIFRNTHLCTVPLLVHLSPLLPESGSDFWLWLCRMLRTGRLCRTFIPSSLVARECQPCCPDGNFYLSTIIGWILGLSHGSINLISAASLLLLCPARD